MNDTRLVTLSRFVRTLVGIAALAIGIAITWALVRTRPEPAARPPAAEAIPVAVVQTLDAPVGRRWKGYGTVRAINSADVPARVGATVESLADSYREGTRVDKGELLLVLDDSDFRRQLQITDEALAAIDAQLALLAIDETTATDSVKLAEDDARFAHADIERAESARRDLALNDREVDRLRQIAIAADRSLIMARETRQKLPARKLLLNAERARQVSLKELAQLNVDRCRIESPLVGVVQIADREIGEMVQSGARVARVVGLDKLEVEILLPASARESLRLGDIASILPDRAEARPFEARISRIAPEDDPLTRTMSAYAEISPTPNSESRPRAGLSPGLFVTAEIACAATGVRTLVPRRSINEGHVLLVEGGRVHLHEIAVDFYLTGAPEGAPIDDREWAALRTALPAGTIVVLDGSRRLSDGARVVGETAAARTASRSGAPESAREAAR